MTCVSVNEGTVTSNGGGTELSTTSPSSSNNTNNNEYGGSGAGVCCGAGSASSSSGVAAELFSNKFVWTSDELKPPFHFREWILREFFEPKQIARITLQGFGSNSPDSYSIAATNDISVRVEVRLRVGVRVGGEVDCYYIATSPATKAREKDKITSYPIQQPKAYR